LPTILYHRQNSVEMKARPKPSVVVFAKSVPRLATFYREVGELTTVHEDQDHIVLEQESFQVVIHGVPPEFSAQIQITEPPQIREEACMKMCLPVESLGRARLKAAEHGGKLGSRDKEWEARGFRACDGHDPEGNVFQARESAA
jgi:predicted enzyme related to lactoylglutathione lyase